MKTIALIPARGGSKGVPRKNVKLLHGKPLIAYTIEAAKDLAIFDRIIVSTDDVEIATVAKEYGAEVPFMRPAELAEDSTPTLPVLVHAMQWLKEHESYEADAITLLQPIAPLRNAAHIREAHALFVSTNADSVVSLREVPLHHNAHWQFQCGDEGKVSVATGESFQKLITRRQELPKTYTRNGAIYIFKARLLFEVPPSFYGKDVRAYMMDTASSINIDTPEDFAAVEATLSH